MTKSAASVVSALALVQSRLAELAVQLRRTPAVVTVMTAVTPRHYASGDRVECYVDAELQSGNWIGAWLEFEFEDGSWAIESSIRYNTDAGEDELVGLPTRYAVEDEELVAELDGASAALVRATVALDLKAL